ncbi:MAG TPA: sugar transferase [Clostridiales bacterium]|nr:sugar transferase [Clostridiales bacterium]
MGFARIHILEKTMYKAFKWVMDRLLALVALLVTGPFIALLALAVAIDSPGNPFMVQKRDGYKRKTIKVIKFRTMFSTNVAFDVDHAVIASDNKSVTRVGRFLRRSKLDELPQIINILKGDMSFVGPRPLLPVYTPRYERWEFQKFAVKPGLTGLSQVRGNGYLSVKSRSYYDALYTEKISLWTDFKILLMTIGVIFRGEAAFIKEATEQEIAEMKNRYQPAEETVPSEPIPVAESEKEKGSDQDEEQDSLPKEKQ